MAAAVRGDAIHDGEDTKPMDAHKYPYVCRMWQLPGVRISRGCQIDGSSSAARLEVVYSRLQLSS